METEVFLNGHSIGKKILIEDANRDIMNYLEEIKYPNNSIVAIYNDNSHYLDVLRSEDEFNLIHKVTTFIREYPYDIADTHLYGIVTSSYASFMLNVINIEYKLFKHKLNKDKNVGLIKRKR